MAIQSGFEAGKVAAEPHLETSPLLSSVVGQNSHSAASTISSNTDGSHINENSEPVLSRGSKVATLWVLMIGVFVANVDSSLVLATNTAIASSFSQLNSASWLTTSYVMGNCVAQPIVGKLSDIFGRKNVLIVCYGLFTIGCTICGIGQTMWQVIVGRSIAGLGGAGMTVIVSILITDLVPKIEVAPWRSYVNVVATTGRMVGGPLGGCLADLIGWRWSFLGQAPLTIFAALLVGWKFNKSVRLPVAGDGETKDEIRSKIGRIDFLGAILLSTAIVSFLFAVDLLGEHGSRSNFAFVAAACLFLILIIAFFLVEAKKAKDPIFPIKLLFRRDVVTAYLIMIFQTGAQLAVSNLY
jgi:MFS family permease